MRKQYLAEKILLSLSLGFLCSVSWSGPVSAVEVWNSAEEYPCTNNNIIITDKDFKVNGASTNIASDDYVSAVCGISSYETEVSNNNVFVTGKKNADVVIGAEGYSSKNNTVYYNVAGSDRGHYIQGGASYGMPSFTSADAGIGGIDDDFGGDDFGIGGIDDDFGGVDDYPAGDVNVPSSSYAADNNTVIFANGVTQQIVGGVSMLQANSNNVIITGGEIVEPIYSATPSEFFHSYVAGGVVTGFLEDGAANNNTVNLGGYLGQINIDFDGDKVKTIYNGSINTINYNVGKPKINATIYGGYSTMANTDVKTGNTLNVFATDIKAYNISNFEKVNFYIPTETSNGNTMLELSGYDKAYDPYQRRYIEAYNTTDLAGIAINADVSSISKLNIGDTITLLKNSNGLVFADNSFAINDKIVDEQLTSYIAEKTENGVVVGKLGYNITEQSLNLVKKQDFLTGKFIDEEGNVEQALTIDFSTGNFKDIYGVYGATGKAKNISSTMNINRSMDLRNTNIWGNNISSTNNTLNISAANVTVKSINNIENLNLYIPQEAINGSMLTVVDALDASKLNITAGVLSNDVVVKAGDKVKLLTSSELQGDPTVKLAKMNQDGLIDLAFEVKQEENSLVATAKSGAKASKNAKAPVETQAANIALLNLGADTLASAGFVNAQAVASGASTMEPFAVASGAKAKINSGSHVDLKAQGFSVGLAKEIKTATGKLLLGPVVEYGHGKYDSYLDNGLHSEGSSHFYGLGLLAKYSFSKGGYYEGSLRAGKMSADYKARTTGLSFDTAALYFGVHAGAGKVVNIDKNNTLDYYCKLFYTHQQGDEVRLNTGSSYNFKGTDSLRSRVGMRLTHAVDSKNQLYAGVAWQQEFDGRSKAKVKTASGTAAAPAPSIKGTTGIVELGWKYNKDKKLSVDLGAMGTLGKQKGLGMNLQLNWKF